MSDEKTDRIGHLRGIPFRYPPADTAHSPQYTAAELKEALRAISSIIAKCEKAFTNLTVGTAQHTLMERRLAALRISVDLIEKEMSDLTKQTTRSK